MHPIILQTMYYMIAGVLFSLGIGLFQRGFFWKFIRARLSFGSLILVKIRGITIDHFALARVEKNFLVFKIHKEKRRISIKDKSVFYRCLGIIWCDVDEQKNSLCKVDYSVVDGFDSSKYEELYTRCLYKPAIADNKEKIMFILLILCLIMSGISIYLAIRNGQTQQLLFTRMNQVAEINKGIIIGATTI